MMLTPMHLCLLVTKDYFDADFLGIYRYLWKAVAFVMLWTVGPFLLYRRILQAFAFSNQGLSKRFL